MKKFCLITAVLIIAGVLTSGCKIKTQNNPIKYQGRLKKYMQPETDRNNSIKAIDLSDGVKLKYDATLGPGDINFDFKIKNPYKYE